MYDVHYAVVLAYARRRVDEATARDVTAEVFLVAWRRLHELPEHLVPWLLRTAHLQLANHTRTEARGARLTARLSGQPGLPTPDHAGAVAADHDIARLLDQLPAGERELLVLTVWDGLEPTDAARVLGCTAVAARARLHRARRRLRALLEQEAGAEGPRGLRSSNQDQEVTS